MDKTLLQYTVLYCTILNCIVQYSVVAKKTKRGDKRPEIEKGLCAVTKGAAKSPVGYK